MAKLTRKHQKVFAGSATNNGQFGSAQVGTKVLSTDLDILQALAAFDNGWNDAVISSQKLPPLEEFQALDHISTRQLAYLFQEGIPEYSSSCTYFQNSIVKKTGTYELYGSLVDNNTGNALPAAVDNTNWKYLGTLGSNGLPAATNTQSNAGSSSTVALVPSNFAQQSKTSEGYQKLPSGVIMQWGSISATSGSADVSLTFPITFPTAVLSIAGTTGATTTGSFCSFNTLTTSGASVGGWSASTSRSVTPVKWLAIGY